jgi:hypothetical protein
MYPEAAAVNGLLGLQMVARVDKEMALCGTHEDISSRAVKATDGRTATLIRQSVLVEVRV